MTIERRFKCAFCTKIFTRKSWFDKHMCTKKKRFMESKNIHTIKAHMLFTHWQRRTGFLRRGKEKTMEEFCKSPYYNTFKELVPYTEKHHIVPAYQYVNWLVENRVPEKYWRDISGLDEYREYYREQEDPESGVEMSVENIKAWCSDRNLNTAQFFNKITPGQALNMVRENRLSPWVLFSYEPCLIDLVNRFAGETLHTLDEHIDIQYWVTKIETEEAQKTRVIELCERHLA